MENNIAYVLCATDKVTKKFYGFYSKGDTFIQTTPSIWFAKFYVGKEGKGIKNALGPVILSLKNSFLAKAQFNSRWGLPSLPNTTLPFSSFLS